MPVLISSWWARLLAMAILPVGAAFLLYELFAWAFPGRVLEETWKTFASLLFLAGALGTVVIAWRARAQWIARTVVGVIVVLPLILGAFLFQVRSKCGEVPAYIGKAQKVEVASCR